MQFGAEARQPCFCVGSQQTNPQEWVAPIAAKSNLLAQLERQGISLQVLMETLDESIQYRICTPYDGQPAGPVVLAGPTCDSADILYEKADYQLPLDLKMGDRLNIPSTGAYTSMYASVGFNGFPPLVSYCV